MFRMSGLGSHLGFVLAVAVAAAPAATAVIWGVAEAEAQWVFSCEAQDPEVMGCCMCYDLEPPTPPTLVGCMAGTFYGQTVCEITWTQCPTVNNCIAM